MSWWNAGGPSFRFQRGHRGTLEWLPRHLTASGELSEQRFASRCACGWVSPPERTQMEAGGDHEDHLLHAWRAEQDRASGG